MALAARRDEQQLADGEPPAFRWQSGSIIYKQ
jgi:hypothetical protein